MTYEVVCAECAETILIEDLGVEVHCPHCQTVLVLTEEDAETTPTSEAAATAEPAAPAPSVEPQVEAPAPEPVPAAETKPEPEPEEEAFPSFDFTQPKPAEPAAADAPVAKPTDAPPAKAPVEDAPNFNFLGQSAEAEEEAPAFNFQAGAPAATATMIATSKDAQAATDSADSPKIVSETTYARRSSEVSRIVFMSLISYSIFITLTLIYLLVQFRTAKPHQLESLPDIQPAEKGKFSFYRENATVAPGHTLALGQSQRFGNVRVTPIKVTRGELRFQHFQGKPNTSKPPSEPVYKLWLKVENVSDDQVFAPLDVELLSLRRMDPKDVHYMRANNWVCSEDDFNSPKVRVLMYDHPATSEYDIVGMVARPLQPGEEVETFLPTEDQYLGKLKGDLIWRFQLRKGYNPESKNGVTTLVDVRFHVDDIRSES